MLVGKFPKTSRQLEYTVCGAIQDLPWHIWLAYNPGILMNICPYWLNVMHQPMSSMCATRISLGLMINEGMLLASSRSLIFGNSMSSPLISGDPLLSLLCCVRLGVRNCLLLLVTAVDWCESVRRLICCRIILTANSPGSLLIYRSRAIRLLV